MWPFYKETWKHGENEISFTAPQCCWFPVRYLETLTGQRALCAHDSGLALLVRNTSPVLHALVLLSRWQESPPLPTRQRGHAIVQPDKITLIRFSGKNTAGEIKKGEKKPSWVLWSAMETTCFAIPCVSRFVPRNKKDVLSKMKRLQNPVSMTPLHSNSRQSSCADFLSFKSMVIFRLRWLLGRPLTSYLYHASESSLRPWYNFTSLFAFSVPSLFGSIKQSSLSAESTSCWCWAGQTGMHVLWKPTHSTPTALSPMFSLLLFPIILMQWVGMTSVQVQI